jgi:hypothetical protein
MKIRGNGTGSSLALSETCEEWSLYCRQGRKVVLDLSSLVCKVTILSANLFNLNTITGRFLAHPELQKCCICDVPSYYEINKTNTKPRNKMNPEQSKNLAKCVIVNA